MVAGGTAYVVTRQQRRVRARYRPVGAHLQVALLDVLAAPGGGDRLESAYSGEGLRDRQTGELYPVVDGIPDFVATPDQGEVYLSGLPGPEDGDWLRWVELIEPLKPRLFGINHTGNAALAGAAGAAAQGGWALSVPCGMGEYEIEMARAHPQTRLICVDARWNMLLEARRKAYEAGVSNLYFVRGSPTLLPLQDASLTAVWTANALHQYAAPERLLTQIARVAKPGALVAGVSLVAGGPRLREALVELAERQLPGRRDSVTHFTLLHVAGLQDVRAFRDGGYIRFTATRT
jgi:SAM-dependent methyltransferase